MAATPSIKVTKQFTYRGVTRKFSNRYHFVGGLPADSAHWTTLSDAIVTAEKALYDATMSIVETFGYAAGSDVPIFTKTYSTAGTFVVGTSNPCAGDGAALIRYATAARTPKNHPVYLFNYYHGARITDTAADNLYPAYLTALGTYAGAWVGAGFSDGSTSYNRAGPQGATATGHSEPIYVTHRDLPR